MLRTVMHDQAVCYVDAEIENVLHAQQTASDAAKEAINKLKMSHKRHIVLLINPLMQPSYEKNL